MSNFKNISNDRIFLSPSILAADFSDMSNEIADLNSSGIESLHLDIMDGHFVPNLTMGPPVIKSIRNKINSIFDTHLMLTNPIDFIEPFKKAGADHITFHLESENNPDEVIKKIKNNSMSVGMSVRPNTNIEGLFPYLEQLDLVLIMTVEPGFGGQSFMPEMMSKVKILREKIAEKGKNIHIEVDGGIDNETINIATQSGANALVAGTSVFKANKSISGAISDLIYNAKKF